MIKKYRELVANDMGDPAGVLIFDESGFAKKGENSAGVAKQHCGSPGKVENCQVGVFASYASFLSRRRALHSAGRSAHRFGKRPTRTKDGSRPRNTCRRRKRSRQRLARFAKKLNKVFWYKRRLAEGTKGPVEYEFTKRRVTL